jgi:hypothetical protein
VADGAVLYGGGLTEGRRTEVVLGRGSWVLFPASKTGRSGGGWICGGRWLRSRCTWWFWMGCWRRRSSELVAGGQFLKCGRGRSGLTPMSSTKSPWPLLVLRRPKGFFFFFFFAEQYKKKRKLESLFYRNSSKRKRKLENNIFFFTKKKEKKKETNQKNNNNNK